VTEIGGQHPNPEEAVVDQDSVDRIRSATFPQARRGYDRHEVERFLAEIADWLETGGTDEARADLVAPELDRIGKQVSNILKEANDAARTMRADAEREVRYDLADGNRKAEEIREGAERYAEETRDEADGYAIKTRAEANEQADAVKAEADAYAEETRGEADAYDTQTRNDAQAAVRELRAKAEKATREVTDKARAEAKRIVDDANRKRGEIEKVIGDLERRREQVVAELRRLASDVAGAAGAPLPDRSVPAKPTATAANAKANGDKGAEEAVKTAK
jgi:DivIVA domain-containing protein